MLTPIRKLPSPADVTPIIHILTIYMSKKILAAVSSQETCRLNPQHQESRGAARQMGMERENRGPGMDVAEMTLMGNPKARGKVPVHRRLCTTIDMVW